VKKVVLILALFLMIPVSSVSATHVIRREGDIFDGDIYHNVTPVNGYTRYTQDFSGTSVNRLKYQSWTDGFGTMVTEKIADADADGQPYMTGVNFTCNTSYRVYIYDANHDQIGFMELVVDDLTNPTCDSGGNAGEEPTPEPDPGTGDCGCVIDIPGWDNMMTKLDEIKSAIPPAPDWQQVANTMRDTIVPAFRSEMEDMLGTAPEPPEPPIFNNPITGGIDEPTGSLPADFEESGFTANDLKADAEEIQFQEDPSGGFELLDPVGSLPTQEEFKKNIPAEQDLQAPEVPDVSGTAPEPPTQENIAPTPPDVTGTAPSPSEEDNIAPSPTEGENVAPTPGDTTGTAPLPGDDSGTAPVPSEDLTTAPLPGEDLTGAPIPSE
jgi:hypothetical protein